jgi:excisionase family DNA binding protein
MSETINNTPNTEALISRKELSARLDVSQSTTRRLEKDNVIQGIKIGGQVRYQWNEVLGALKTRGGKK